MNNINWNDYYRKTTLKSRREYLRGVFNDKQKTVNKMLFVVNPIEMQEGSLTLGQSIRKRGRQTVNLFRRLARHIILPFPITWTHKNSDRLVQKGVISIEDYIMGDLTPKDFFSALRIGVSQYPNFLFGGVFALTGLAATLVVATTASFGLAIPIAGFCLGLGYIAYASMRAIRKPKTLVGYLKSKMLHEKSPGHKVEQLFIKMYTLVNILEREKKTIKRNSTSEAKAKIKKIIFDDISDIFYEGEDKSKVQIFSKLVEAVVNPFIEKMNLPDDISSNQLLNDLNELIINLENIDIFEKFIANESRVEMTTRFAESDEVKERSEIEDRSVEVIPRFAEIDEVKIDEVKERSEIVDCKDEVVPRLAESDEDDSSLEEEMKANESRVVVIPKLAENDEVKINSEIVDSKVELISGLTESEENENCFEKENVDYGITIEEKTINSSRFEEIMQMKKVIKTVIKELNNNKQYTQSAMLSVVLQKVNLNNFDKDSFITKIRSSNLGDQYKSLFISKLEETSKINFKTALNYKNSVIEKEPLKHVGRRPLKRAISQGV